jgi:hypothetical protein
MKEKENFPMSEETKNLPGNGFDDNGTDADRLIQGTIIKCVDGHWHDRDGLGFPPETTLIAMATAEALQRWENQYPVETIVKQPGASLPNLDELNKAIPEDQWEEGINGPRPPWCRQHIVYLIDPEDASLYTFINGTVGAAIAVGRLKDKVKWMRALRGANVCPVVKLDARPMKTKFGQKMRPEFTIVDWRELGGETAPQPAQLSAPAENEHAGIKKYLEVTAGKKVKPVTTEEDLSDEIPW